MDIKRQINDWTLPIAMATGVVVYLLFHFTEALQPVAQWYYPFNNTVLPLCTFAVLYVTFCRIDFGKMRLVKWHLWLALQQILVGAGIMLLTTTLQEGGKTLVLLEATLVCVISPCATAAAVVTAKLGGNLEEMTSYTLLSNFISAVLIPLCFIFLPTSNGTFAGSAGAFVLLFLTILWKVSAILLLPMAAAIATKYVWPALHTWIAAHKDLGYYLWGLSLFVVTATTAMNICDAWHYTSLAFLLSIAIAALAACVFQFAIGRYFGRHYDKVIEAGQGLGQKNTTFAIWVATAFLNPLCSVGPGCYILWQNIINSMEIYLHNKHDNARNHSSAQ